MYNFEKTWKYGKFEVVFLHSAAFLFIFPVHYYHSLLLNCTKAVFNLSLPKYSELPTKGA